MNLQCRQYDFHARFRPVDMRAPCAVVQIGQIEYTLGLPCRGADHLVRLQNAVSGTLCLAEIIEWLPNQVHPRARYFFV